MSTRLRFACGTAVAILITTLAGVDGSGAFAQSTLTDLSLTAAPTAAVISATPVVTIAEPVVQPLPTPVEQANPFSAQQSGDQAADQAGSDASNANSLGSLVAATRLPTAMSDELNCLAGAIYFEAKGESLAGQLAVGKVIVARSQSGRFPASYCGVVYQPSQFSFVRGGSMPAINKSGRAWADAAKIAHIAHQDTWDSPVEGALFFHAKHVSPNWRLKRMARIDNHIFYR